MATQITREYIKQFQLPDTAMLVIEDGLLLREYSSIPLGVEWRANILSIAPAMQIAIPLHLIFFFTKDISHSWQMKVGAGSVITLYEEYLSLTDSEPRVEIVTQIELEKKASLQQFRWGGRRLNGQLQITLYQYAESKLTRNFMQSDDSNFQEQLAIKLVEDSAHCIVNGLNYLAHCDYAKNKISVEHCSPNCTSKVFVKGVVEETGTNDFSCRVIVRPEAKGTRAEMVNNNLLLTERAVATSAPELEIYTDEVQCSHGMTVGGLDHDALFYLQSRGVAREVGQRLLIGAFINEILALFPKYDRLAAESILPLATQIS